MYMYLYLWGVSWVNFNSIIFSKSFFYFGSNGKMHKAQEEKWKMKAFLIARDAIVKQFQLLFPQLFTMLVHWHEI